MPGLAARLTRLAWSPAEAEVMNSTIRRTCEQLSLPLVAPAAAVFASGLVSGWYTYQDRSPYRQKYVPGASAWWQHAVLAAVACLIFGYAGWRRQREHGRPSGHPLVRAPVAKPAAARIARTVRSAARGEGGVGRSLLAAVLAALILYNFWRAGLQVLGGLDPNMTVNAWGGPTYVGAMACHYLDGFLLITVAAWLLDRILLPDSATYRPLGTSNSHKSAVDLIVTHGKSDMR